MQAKCSINVIIIAINVKVWSTFTHILHISESDYLQLSPSMVVIEDSSVYSSQCTKRLELHAYTIIYVQTHI